MVKTKNKPRAKVRVILVTAPEKEAEPIARALLKERLIACANLVPNVSSLYWWEGKIECGAEMLLILKTQKNRVPQLLKRLKELHSYTVPEFLALPVRESNSAYSEWVLNETEE